MEEIERIKKITDKCLDEIREKDPQFAENIEIMSRMTAPSIDVLNIFSNNLKRTTCPEEIRIYLFSSILASLAMGVKEGDIDEALCFLEKLNIKSKEMLSNADKVIKKAEIE